MVSIALCGEMETELHCQEAAVEAGELKVNQDIGECLEKDSNTNLPRGSSAEEVEDVQSKEQLETVCSAEVSQNPEIRTFSDPEQKEQEKECQEMRKFQKRNSWKTVRFQEPSEDHDDGVLKRDSSAESLFTDYVMEEWTRLTFEKLFEAEDWQDVTEDQLLRKKVLEPVASDTPRPTWGQEVTVKMQGVLEDCTVVEKDCKLVFAIGEGDVTQALEECVLSMQKGEITLLLADSQYAYGLLGREPDIPAWTPILYQLQLLDIRDKPEPLTLSVADRIRIGNQKRERGNFHFQREEYSMAARAYCMALDVLTTCGQDGKSSSGGSSTDGAVEAKKEVGEVEEVRDCRVKCLNNLAVAHMKLDRCDEALRASRDVLTLDPNNVKALFRAGKLLSDKSEYNEAMELLKRALKLEPSTKAIHVELSKLVRKQSGVTENQSVKPKPAETLTENISAPFLIPAKANKPGSSWRFALGALVVALGSLVTSVILTARQ